MIYQSNQMEEQAVLQTAVRMCAAARTAPKAHGKDFICTLVLTGDEKNTLAEKMDEIHQREFSDSGKNWFNRDANNVRSSQAVVLVGVKQTYRGVAFCSFCGFENCAACEAAGGNCAFIYVDLGIALSSAVTTAAMDKVDTRIMLSVGKAAMEMNYMDDDVLWHGVPLSISGKSVFFDRK